MMDMPNEPFSDDWGAFCMDPSRFESHKWLTIRCAFYFEGRCKRGQNCFYAHSEEELRWGWQRWNDARREALREQQEFTQQQMQEVWMQWQGPGQATPEAPWAGESGPAALRAAMGEGVVREQPKKPEQKDEVTKLRDDDEPCEKLQSPRGRSRSRSSVRRTMLLWGAWRSADGLLSHSTNALHPLAADPTSSVHAACALRPCLRAVRRTTDSDFSLHNKGQSCAKPGAQLSCWQTKHRATTLCGRDRC
jgi:hypothetical protein